MIPLLQLSRDVFRPLVLGQVFERRTEFFIDVIVCQTPDIAMPVVYLLLRLRVNKVSLLSDCKVMDSYNIK